MKQLTNNLYRHLEADEFIGLMDAVKTLERIFKKKIHSVHVNATVQNKNDIYGVAFSFDMIETEREKSTVSPQVM